VKLIRDAGGVAVVAHWYTVSKKIDARMLEGMIEAGRIDGVELMGNPLNSMAQRAQPVLRAMAERTGCLATYGVDGHREQDIENFIHDRELARRTSGQTARLIAKTGVGLEWTNLG
jgi:histidinol phosphatase-like PHP family hydrolase